jgi:transcriptional regulator GlxA family with amidase domain
MAKPTKAPGLAARHGRFLSRFAERDAVPRDAMVATKDMMEEVAWEMGYEHATSGRDSFESTVGDFADLAKALGADIRGEFDRGFREA